MRMMKVVTTALFALLVYAGGVEGFTPSKIVMCPEMRTMLDMSQLQQNLGIQSLTAASLVTASLIFGNLVTVGPANAAASLDVNNVHSNFSDGATSHLIAARSGGRAGGRSSGYRSAPRPSSSSRTTTNTRIIERTHYVPSYSSPSVIVAPPVYYNPLPGYGLGLGLNAINQIGNDMRDYRQENEIRDARSQLEQSRMREAEMEARLRVLEQGQVNQQQLTTQQQLMMLQQQQQPQKQ
jgi:hypothetical protein